MIVAVALHLINPLSRVDKEAMTYVEAWIFVITTFLCINSLNFILYNIVSQKNGVIVLVVLIS